MRKGFDALCGIVQQHMNSNVLKGGVYIFINRKRNQIKLLTWEGDGLAIYYKRLEKGVYDLPSYIRTEKKALFASGNKIGKLCTLTFLNLKNQRVVHFPGRLLWANKPAQ